MKAVVREQNRRSSWNTFLLVLVANAVLASIWFAELWVPQSDFSKLDKSVLAANIKKINGYNASICFNTSGLAAEKALRKELAPFFSQESIAKRECDSSCSLCFNVSEGSEDMKKQALVQVESKSRVSVTLKTSAKVPKEFGLTLSRLSVQLGFNPAGNKASDDAFGVKAHTTIDSVKSVNLNVYTMLDEAGGAPGDASDLCAIAKRAAFKSLQQIWPEEVGSFAPQIVCSRRAFSQETLPDIFMKNAEPDTVLISSEKVLDYFNQHSQLHLISNFSRAKQDQVRNIRLNLFDRALIPQEKDVKFSQQSMKFSVIQSSKLDQTFAVVDSATSSEVQIQKQVAKLMDLSLEDALAIDNYQKIVDQAKRRQVVITCADEEMVSQLQSAQIETFLTEQRRLDLIKQLQDLASVIEMLGLSRIESTQVVYQQLSIKELAEHVYDQLTELTTITPKLEAEGLTVEVLSQQPVPHDVKEKIGTLLQTKKMNAPAFFSFQFTIGVYLPILSPFLVPIILTFTGYIKAQFQATKDSKVAQ